MMPEIESPWFRLGHAFERTLQTLSSPGMKISTLRERAEEGSGSQRKKRRDGGSPQGEEGGERRARVELGFRPDRGGSGSRGSGAGRESSNGFGENLADRVRQAFENLPIDEEELAHVIDALFAAGGGAVVHRLLERLGRGGAHSTGALVRAGVAGAGAALVVQAMRPLLERDGKRVELDTELAYAVMGGVGRGLIYGLLLHRRIPGPSGVRGAIYGTAEYLVGPWGGISQLLHPLTPQGSLPIVGPLLDPGDTSEETLVEHLLFGTTLALIYGLGED